jgi:hypothetical protein
MSVILKIVILLVGIILNAFVLDILLNLIDISYDFKMALALVEGIIFGFVLTMYLLKH